MKERNLFAGAHGVWWPKSNPVMITSEPHEKSSVPTIVAATVTTPAISTIDSSEHFLKIIFDLGYYAGAIPYHIKYDKSLRDFVIHKNRLQMVYSTFIRVVVILRIINHILILKMDMVGKDPTLYFQLFRRVTFLITFTAWFISTSTKPTELRKFVALSYKALPGNYRKIAKTLITTLCLTYTIIGTIGGIFIVDKTHWNFEDLIKAYMYRVKFTFHYLYNVPSGNQIVASEIYDNFSTYTTPIHTVILSVFIQMFMDFFHDASAWILYMFMISTVVVIWLNVNYVRDEISSSSTTETISPVVIYHKYTALKEMTGTVNSIIGFAVLGWVPYIVPFTSLKLSDVTADPDWFLLLFNLVYFSHVCAFLILAADSCAKVAGFMNEWLTRDDVMFHFTSKKHCALLIELSNNPVAIRSYNGVFTITYSFIGNLFTLMASFFIIITQFKMAASETPIQTPKV